MGAICSYLCCGCCRQNPNEERKLLRTKKQKNLNILKDITPPKKSIIDKPAEVKTIEMTDYYKLPCDNLETEEDVFKSLGYESKGLIDSGGFATVHKAIHIEQRLEVAYKKIPIPEALNDTSKKQRQNLITDIKNELYVLQKTDHPNVIKMIQHFIIIKKNKMTFYIIMQLAQGGNLSNKLDEYGPFNERQCKRWFAQMLSGLNYMHSMSIAHRDLKLGNILLDVAQDILISDFGLSRFVWREGTNDVMFSQTYCGTPSYMAPEILLIPVKKQNSIDYGYNAFEADIWGLGVILFKLFNKRYPFSFAKGKPKALKTMNAKKWEFARVKEAPSHDFRDMMSKIFEPKPELRIDLKSLTEHQWIRKTFRSVEEKNNKRTNKS